MVVGEAQNDTVVHHHAVGLAHDAVAGTARLERAHHARVETIEELAGILALDVDLAECRGVHHADAIANGRALAQHRGVHVLVALREEPRALPLADVLEDRAVCDVPRVDRGRANRVEAHAKRAPGERAERHRLGERTRVGDADLGEVESKVARSQASGVDLRGAPLLGSGAHERVALHVLNVMNARAQCAFHASERNVAVLVDERVDWLGARDVDEVSGRPLVGVMALRSDRPIGGGAVARGLSGHETNHMAVAPTPGGAEDASGGARHANTRQRAIRDEADELAIPARPTRDVQVQIEERVPPTGDGEAVAGDRLGHATVERRHAHRGEYPVGISVGADHGGVIADLDAEFAGALDQRALRVLAYVNDHLHRHTGTREVDRRAVGVVTGGEDHELLGHEAEAMQEATHAGREHDARAIVVGENQWALGSAGRNDEFVRADLPHATQCTPFALRLGQVLRDALHQRDGTLVAVVERGRAGENRHVGVGAQARLNVGHPAHRRLVVDQLLAAEQRTTQVRLAVDEDHAGARVGSSQRGTEAGRSGTDDEYVAVREALLEAGSLALRGQEPLVQASRGLEAGEDLELVHAHQRLGHCARTDLRKRVRVGHVVGDHAAGAAHQDAGADHIDAVGQQCGGECVARVRGQRAAVVREVEGVVVVDAATIIEALHRASAGCSPTRYDPTSSCVPVSRITLNQRRHPAAWFQRSA